MPSEESMGGAQRAAVFLLSIGEEAAAAILRQMEPREVQLVGEAMTSLSAVSNAKLATVVGEFNATVENSALGNDTGGFIKRVLNQALGADKARGMIGRILQRESSAGMDALKWMDPESVALLLKDEHPQICALVMTSLEGDHAAAVLRHLSDKRRSEIVLRIARLETIHPSALEDLEQMLEKQLSAGPAVPSAHVDGIKTAAEILNHLDSNTEAALLDSIKEVDEELGESIKDKMFIFENLLSLDDRGFQRLLRDISGDDLVVALKGSDEQVKEKFFKNMSQRAAEMLQEDLESKGPVKISEVETTQKEILNTAVRLAEEGELTLGSKGGDDFV